MLLEALEILQSAGGDEDSFVTDFAIYKVITVLSIYLPLGISTFLLSQEYLGEKIACFAPENFTDSQADALKEYCWNNGFWLSEDVPMIKSLYTQPHRYYPLYLPIQSAVFMVPVIMWNIVVKSQVLASIRGTDQFLEDLMNEVQKEQEEEDRADNCRTLIKQFHHTCITAARTANIARVAFIRVGIELFLIIFVLCLQFLIYNHKEKEYYCAVPELTSEAIYCTVPILDLLDVFWSLNVGAMVLAMLFNAFLSFNFYRMHYSDFQPLFYNSLPYGDTDDFNEQVVWDSRWTKDSYRLLIRIFLENTSIMTKAYVLQGLKPASAEAAKKSKQKTQPKHPEELHSLNHAPVPTFDPNRIRRRETYEAY